MEDDDLIIALIVFTVIVLMYAYKFIPQGNWLP